MHHRKDTDVVVKAVAALGNQAVDPFCPICGQPAVRHVEERCREYDEDERTGRGDEGDEDGRRVGI